MAEQEPVRLVIDTDIGVDDAVALLLALRSPAARVEAITTVGGNVDVDQCVRNARYVLELCDRRVPVYRGAALPPRRRAALHGSDGLGDLGLRPRSAGPDAGTASEALIALARANPGSLTLVTLGPLTNLALALKLAPDLPAAFRRVVVMGGTNLGPGTITARAEFNIWCDPVSAREVLSAGLPLTLAPIDLSRGPAACSPADQAQLGSIGSSLARFVQMMCEAAARARGGATPAPAGLPDAIAMAIALEPSLVQRSNRYYVDVETGGGLTRGETIVDRLGLTGLAPNLEMAEELDAERYKAMLRDACRHFR